MCWCWGSGSHVEWKLIWCHYIIVEADSHLKLAFRIHLRHIQSVWAHWYDVHRHIVPALHSYTLSTCLRFGGSGSHVESKLCHYVIVKADSRGSIINYFGQKEFALNTIFRFVSCLYILWPHVFHFVEISTHSLSIWLTLPCSFSYYWLTSDWLVIQPLPLMITPQWHHLPLPVMHLVKLHLI